MAGLTSEGFDIPSAEDIRTDVNAAQQSAFGPQVDTTDGSVLGQLTAIPVSLAAELWELAQAVYGSLDPDTATGERLDEVCALTGTTRLAALGSTDVLTLTGTNATLVSAGSQVSVTNSGALFATDADATLATLTAWANTTAYVIGDRVTNASRAYVATTAGTSAGSGGPTTTSSAITDGSVVWRYMGEGAAAVDVDSTAVLTGATVAVSGSIATIETAVSGWSSVVNLLDAVVGRAVEVDRDLRVRRLAELAASGSAPIDALRADLLEVSGVTSVTVFENPTDVTDADGVPPHAVECMVQGGDDQDILDQLLASVAAGIATSTTATPPFNITGTATDSEGTSHDVAFSRPEEVPIYAALTITYDADLYPEDGDDQVKLAVATYGTAQKAGKDAVSSATGAQAFQVAGVIDVVHAYIGIAPAPVATTTVAISLRQQATWDTSRVTVSSSAATP